MISHNEEQERGIQHKKLLELLTFPGEQRNVEYKEAVPFKEREEFSYKLVKHILGMANAGGGYIVIGFTERDGLLQSDPGLDDAVVSSYDTTKLLQYVAKFVRGNLTPEVTVEKVKHGGRVYPIISVGGFEKTPFFCGSTVPQERPILKEGALYMRDRLARTVVLASPQQWEDLIGLCVSKRQSELIGVFREFLAEIRTGKVENRHEYLEYFKELVERETHKTQSELRKKHSEELGWWFWHAPIDGLPKRNLVDLVDCMKRAELPYRDGLRIGLVSGRDPTPSGDRIVKETQFEWDGHFHFARWILHQRGGFVHFMSYSDLPRGERKLSWNVRICQLTEALDHCEKLYIAMQVPMDAQIAFRIDYSDLRGRIMTNTDPRRPPLHPYKCNTDSISPDGWQGSFGEFIGSIDEIIINFTKALFQNFDFFSVPDNIVRELIREHRKGRR
ncbi:MAG: hypothetical protein DRP00_03480 [Candidatus Aenigmatarchaeota archaeon]|nr:MAG: hypothetical protein DRP00_03480 [Candidatus Aenigmarchaeota archaeon]